jgi:hypothetical protein
MLERGFPEPFVEALPLRALVPLARDDRADAPLRIFVHPNPSYGATPIARRRHRGRTRPEPSQGGKR